MGFDPKANLRPLEVKYDKEMAKRSSQTGYLTQKNKKWDWSYRKCLDIRFFETEINRFKVSGSG